MAIGRIRPIVPVGPRYGWVIVAVLTLLLAASHGLLSSGISVFDSAILSDLKIGRAELKFRDVVQLFAGGAWAIVIGFAADRLGPRTVIYAGLAVLAAVLVAYGQVTAVEQIYFLHFFLAFAYSSCHVVVVVLVLARWFEKRRSTALGIILAGESLGGAVLPVVLVTLIGELGWREAMYAMALAPVFLALMLVVFLRGTPEQHGQLPIGGPRKLPVSGVKEQGGEGFWSYLASPRLWMILAIAFGLFYAGGGTAAHSFLYFSDLGFDPEWAATSLSLIFVCAFAGKFGGGFLAERWPGARAWIVAQTVMLGGLLCLTAGTPITIWPGIALFGLGWGASYTLTQATVMEMFQGPCLGRLSGIVVLVEGIAAGLGSYLGGWLFDSEGNYVAAFAVMSMTVSLAIMATVVLDRRALARSTDMGIRAGA